MLCPFFTIAVPITFSFFCPVCLFHHFFYPTTLIFDYLSISEHRTHTRTSRAEIRFSKESKNSIDAEERNSRLALLMVVVCFRIAGCNLTQALRTTDTEIQGTSDNLMYNLLPSSCAILVSGKHINNFGLDPTYLSFAYAILVHILANIKLVRCVLRVSPTNGFN
jgi:hypothetical protein